MINSINYEDYWENLENFGKRMVSKFIKIKKSCSLIEKIDVPLFLNKTDIKKLKDILKMWVKVCDFYIDSDYFYIKYEEGYIKTDKIATIIDYGKSFIKLDNKIYTAEKRQESNPFRDLFRMICFYDTDTLAIKKLKGFFFENDYKKYLKERDKSKNIWKYCEYPYKSDMKSLKMLINFLKNDKTMKKITDSIIYSEEKNDFPLLCLKDGDCILKNDEVYQLLDIMNDIKMENCIKDVLNRYIKIDKNLDIRIILKNINDKLLNGFLEKTIKIYQKQTENNQLLR